MFNFVTVKIFSESKDIAEINFQWCVSRMFIPDPGSWFLSISDPRSRITDPGSNSNNKKRRGGKFVVLTSFVATNFSRLKNISFLNRYRKIFEPTDKELKYFLPQKLSLSFQKYGLGIRDPEKTYTKSRGSKRHRTPDPQHRKLLREKIYSWPCPSAPRSAPWGRPSCPSSCRPPPWWCAGSPPPSASTRWRLSRPPLPCTWTHSLVTPFLSFLPLPSFLPASFSFDTVKVVPPTVTVYLNTQPGYSLFFIFPSASFLPSRLLQLQQGEGCPAHCYRVPEHTARLLIFFIFPSA